MVKQINNNIFSENPIGIFDSGVGGLSVAKELCNHLPNENIIYFGDTAHTPWGERSADAIKSYTKSIVEFLISKNCKVILIACNTASSVALEYLKTTFPNQIFFDVVTPTVSYLSNNFASKKVGLLATKQTVKSSAYTKNLCSSINMISRPAPLLVSVVEEGFSNTQLGEVAVNSYLENPDFNDISAMVLGCTHFPFLKNHVIKYYQNNVEIVDSSIHVILDLKQYLESKDLLKNTPNPKHIFYVSDLTNHFSSLANHFFQGCDLQLNNIWGYK